MEEKDCKQCQWYRFIPFISPWSFCSRAFEKKYFHSSRCSKEREPSSLLQRIFNVDKCGPEGRFFVPADYAIKDVPPPRIDKLVEPKPEEPKKEESGYAGAQYYTSTKNSKYEIRCPEGLEQQVFSFIKKSVYKRNMDPAFIRRQTQWTKKENDMLKMMATNAIELGKEPDWETMSKQLFRSPYACKRRWYRIRKGKRK